jgi:hypothetical protein
MRSSRLRPALLNINLGAGRVAGPDTAARPEETLLFSRTAQIWAPTEPALTVLKV